MKLSLLLFLILSAAMARADETVVVLGSDGPAYERALTGFKQAFAEPVILKRAPDTITRGRGNLLIVAIGGRAALRPYPAGSSLIVCLAPGLARDRIPHSGRISMISLLPSPQAVFNAFSAKAPELRRLGVLWSSRGFDGYVDALEREAEGRSLRVVRLQAVSSARLPETLRDAHERVDAVWVLSDPALAAPETISLLSRSLKDWHIRWYSASSAMAAQGSQGWLGASFEEIGAAAAAAARDSLTGHMSTVYYPAKVEFTAGERQPGVTSP